MATLRKMSIGVLQPASGCRLVFRVVCAYNYHPHRLSSYLRSELAIDTVVKRTGDKEVEVTVNFDGKRTVEEHIGDVLTAISKLDGMVSEAKIQEDLLSMVDE